MKSGYLKLCVVAITMLIILKHGAVAQVLTLDSVLLRVESDNPMILEYDQKAKALDQYALGATSWMAPMIGAGTFMRPYVIEKDMHDADKGAWMFSVEQDIPNPGKLKANRRYLQSRSSVEQETRRIEINNLRSEAKMFYYGWLVSERKLIILQENERALQLMLKLAQIRYPYNQGSLGNIYKTEGRLSEVQNLILMTQGEIDESKIRIKALMNAPLSDSIRVDTSLVVTPSYSELTNDTASLAESRSDLRQINKSIEVMKLNQELQRSQSKPDFKIRFDHMRPKGEMPSQFTAMAMISIPIAPWSSKMYRSEIKAMQYEIDAMKTSREGILSESRGMIVGLANRLKNMKQQLLNYETRIIPALKKNYQTVMVAYEENAEQLPMVIDGWEAMNMAQLEYLNKLQEYYLMIVAYEKETEK